MILAQRLNGRKVISSDAKHVGKIGGIYLDINKMKITHLAVDLSADAIGLLGYKKPRTPFVGSVSVCLPLSIVNVVGDIITLKSTFKELPNLPIDTCKFAE